MNDKEEVKSKIIKTPVAKITNEFITNIKNDVIKSGMSPVEIKTSIIANLMIQKNFSCKEGTNFTNLVWTLMTNQGSVVNQFERILRFPSESSFNELWNYLAMATQSIKIWMYTFTHRILMKKLMEAKERGVDVMLITDKESLSTIYIHEMAAKGIKWTHHNLTSHSKMHNKFWIIDDYILLNGSLNWTVKGVKQNHENVMVTGSKMFISEFNDNFNSLWADYDHNILSQAESAKRVDLEMTIVKKKRELKESNKQIEQLSKRVAKITEKINESNRLWHLQGDSNVENMYASEQIMESIHNMNKMIKKLTVKRKLQSDELEKKL